MATFITKSHVMPTRTDPVILQEALDALRTKTGLQAKVLPTPKDKAKIHPDALIEIEFNGQKQRFVTNINAIDRRIAVAQVHAQLEELIADQYPAYRPLLITPFVTTALADECKRLDLPFLDTVGNLSLRTDAILVYVKGEPRPAKLRKDEYRAYQPAGLKLIFALLCRPTLVEAQYRELARFARVALGAVGPILKDLERRGYLRKGKTTKLLRTKELVQEWVTYYPANLRPKLQARRFQADRDKLLAIDLAPLCAYWGGEYAAERLTHYLRAERFTIYLAGPPPPPLLTGARMRLAADGNTEILQIFWNRELVEPAATIVPPLLIYAEFMATADARNVETAKQLYEQFLKPTFNQAENAHLST
jgi:hypothetical protein